MARMGVDPDKIQLFTTMFDGRELENTLGHVNKDGHNTSLLFLSRFVKEKGVYELLEAFINLVSNHKNIHLILAGTGPEEDNMKKIVCDSNIENKVTFTGYVRGSDKARVLMGADIFVFPTSYGEGCPVSLLESMAAGMAVITTPVGGIPHIVEDGKQGILLTNEVTAKSVENAIERLLVDPVETRKIGDLNREQAWRLYNAPVVTGWFESIYKNGCPQSE
jgi:glycosyltransferase involved in cell wall biosynthesis